MGKMQRRKGRRWEQDVAAVFRALFGQQVKRGWQTREGHDAPDVDGTPFHIEAKHHRTVNIAAAIKQALADRKANGDTRWVLAVTKSDRQVPLATMPFDEFMQLVREWVDAKEELSETVRLLDLARHGALPSSPAERYDGEGTPGGERGSGTPPVQPSSPPAGAT